MSAPVFYLGTHRPYWLWNGAVDVPLFVSHSTLKTRKSAFPAATVPSWALDSGGFSELQHRGEWTVTPREYVQATARYDREIGRLDWAAPQDWMCEDAIIGGGTYGGQRFAGTHLSVAEHQRRTVANFLDLAELWPQFSDSANPYMPVLQGKPGVVSSYLAHAAMYEDAGIHLADFALVGVGSVCRLQESPAIGRLARGLAPLGLSLHWFGLKLTGLPAVWPHIASHDSLAWSLDARRTVRMPGCTHVRQRGPKAGRPSSCANCAAYALRWRALVVSLTASLRVRPYQPDLFSMAELEGAP